MVLHTLKNEGGLKMKLSKKKQALIVSVSLVALLVTGIVAVQNLDNFNLNSKAESVDLDKQEYKDFITMKG